MAKVPAQLAKALDGRIKSPLGEDGLVRFQRIGMAPGITTNFRVVVMDDGRCFVARNKRSAERRPGVVYNVPMPDEPTVMLPHEVVAQIRARLDEVGFFAEEPYVEETGVKDGSLSIVTARRDGREHEVWYMRTDNALTNMLHELADATGEQSSWADLLEEQMTLRSKLEDR